MNVLNKSLIGIITAILLMPSVWAGELIVPNTFISGTKAVAADVNANFNEVKVEVDDNAADILVNAGNISANTTAVADKVDKAGDTMTGDLVVNGRVGVGSAISGGELFVQGSEGRTYGNFTNAVIYTSRVFNDNSGGSIGFGGIFDSTGGTTLFAGIYGRKENLTDGDGDGYLAFTTKNTINTEKVRITSAGNVGIATTTPATKLHVNGTITASAFVQVSDERLKKNIKPIESPLQKINNLKGVSYEWETAHSPDLNLDSGKQMGLIAQDVLSTMPEAVKGSAEQSYSVNYSMMIPLLIEAMKEQQQMIESLRSQLHELKRGM